MTVFHPRLVSRRGVSLLVTWLFAAALPACVPDLGEALDDDVSGDDDTGDDDDSWMEPPEPIEMDCDWELYHWHEGDVLEVEPGVSTWSIQPLPAGERFLCAALRFEFRSSDNLDHLRDTYEGCPAYLALATIEGTGDDGAVLGDAAFHPHVTDTCDRGPDSLDLRNFLASTEGTEGPWPPGETWVVEMRVEPFFSRITLFQDGEPVGPYVETPLSDGVIYASFENTRDARFSLGIPAILDEQIFPWYGATYANVQVWGVPYVGD